MKFHVVILALFVSGSLLFGFKVKNDLIVENKKTQTKIKEDDTIPELSLPDRKGVQTSLRQIAKKNKVVLISFWASWCRPCRLEMPQIDKIRTKFKDKGFEIIAINVDNDKGDAEKYLKARPVSFPVLFDEGEKASDLFGVRAIPTSFLVDGTGKVLSVNEGIGPYLEFLVKWRIEEGDEKKAKRKSSHD